MPNLLLVADIISLSVVGSGAVHFPWMYYLPYGQDVTLKPLYKNETQAQNLTITSCRWTTPRNVDLYPGQPNLDTQRYHIDARTCELTIFNNQKDTNGVYHCTVNEMHISKAMLNVHGQFNASSNDQPVLDLIQNFFQRSAQEEHAGKVHAEFDCGFLHCRR